MYSLSGLRNAVGAIAWFLLGMSRLANAYCECGYSVNKTSDSSFALFTDLLENDFLHTRTTNFTAVGWRPQEYNVSAKDARGPFGKQFVPENIEANPLKDPYSWAGNSDRGGDAGLQLWVRGDHSHGFVSGAEMASVRDDALYGSFRVAMRLSGSAGTCGAFFWFYNNSQEIDMEFLSKQFNSSQGVVNLVLQTPQSVKEGFDASNTSDFKVQPLPFRPDQEFHEYRFDWSPQKVSFYVDGGWLQDFTENIPSESGRMFMNHWSNGDPLWSAGPPGQDTALIVSYIKAYFNSSDTARQKDYKTRCPTVDATKVCQIPDQIVAPNPSGANGNKTAHTYFFSLDGGYAPNQTVYNTTNATRNSALRGFASSSSTFAYVPLFIALFSWAIST
ncbi:concanavalin A-like lectin/glucanase [Lindgomyces ingoldianus]|uniref:Concanavalin A-like lectin/glucanase n=1 Tax=Lindgomyces ingoldianus TaxID=673940 RepID=A0ACB6QQC2_9PLEO|nr:concanavalin A-like lectin/glucanase [Lindgomyces ingoldianus]KAF2468773.1 concanavalin A-like lectin/glucanase [Lindgomyces ingoldianus]